METSEMLMLSAIIAAGMYPVWVLFVLPSFKSARLQKQAKSRALPKSLKPVTDKSFDDSDLLDYWATFEHMQAAMREGRLNSISSQALTYCSSQFGVHAAMSIAARRHPVLFIVTAIASLGVLVLVLYVLQSATAGKFEREARAFVASGGQTTSGEQTNPHSKGLSDQLSELTRLHQSGALSADEFASAKAQLLKKAS